MLVNIYFLILQSFDNSMTIHVNRRLSVKCNRLSHDATMGGV